MLLLQVRQLYAEDLPVEEVLSLAEARAGRSGQIMVGVAKTLLFVCSAGSVALALTGFSVNLNGPLPGIGIGLTALTLIPALLQTLDWLWPHAPIGRYRLAFERLNTRFTSLIQQRMTAQVLARYGRQDLARRILPAEQAARYDIASWLQRRKRHRKVALAAGMLAASGIAGLVIAVRLAPGYRLGHLAVLDSGFSAEALTAPDCVPGRAVNGTPTCSVDMRFRNVSSFPELLGPGSFTSIGPDENPIAGTYSYAVALVSNGNYYDFDTASFAGTPGEVQPGQAVALVLTFTVPAGVHPDAMEMQSETTGAGIRIDFPQPSSAGNPRQ